MCESNCFFAKGGPQRDSQSGWFPRNFWPPKFQLHSWKTQFKLKLSHGVIIVETKNSNSSCSTHNLRRHSMFWKTFFALIRFQGTLRCQDSSPNQALVSRSTHITATNDVGNVHETLEKIPCKSAQKAIFSLPKGFGNQSRRECPRKQLIVFCQKIPCKSAQKAICSLPKGFGNQSRRECPRKQLL